MAPYLSRPGMISLAGGVPDPALFPVAEVEKAVAAALARDPSLALQYGRTRGHPELVSALARRLAGLGIEDAEARLFVTAGSQQALDLVGRLLLDPGDTMVVETPTYAGALSAFRGSGARFEALASSGPSPDPEDLSRACERASAAGSVARALYLLPNFQNPAGTSLAPEARTALLAAASGLGLVVIEDNPYRDLWFATPPPAPMAAGAGAAKVFYLGSLSKVLAPGLRLGFIVVPADYAERFERLKEATDLCTSTLSQSVALGLLQEGVLDANLPALRKAYAERARVLVDAVHAELGAELRHTRPQGGFFCWLELPPEVDAERLLELALEDRVAFVAGRLFHAMGGGGNTLRLAYSKEPVARLGEGVQRLAGSFRRLLARPC